jgi:quercetin dioxygenase-like cupin family protein
VLVRSRLAVVAGILLLPLTAAGAYAAGQGSGDDAPPTAVREVLAQVDDPAGAKGRTLALSRVTIPPRTALALHRHPGNQIAYIQRGTLTYTVRSGVVSVYRGPADGSARLVRKVRPGQTGVVRRGEWVVERPGDVHFGANRGSGRVVILLATLFRKGAPASIEVPEG